jgi:hypothetical protein
MHLLLYMFFITNAYMLQSPYATIPGVYSMFEVQ